MSGWAVIAAVAVPILAQVGCLLFLTTVDPCRNNPGCMAGSLSGYAAILIMPATVVVLLVATLIEWATGRVSGRVALTINATLALLPFALIFGLLFTRA